MAYLVLARKWRPTSFQDVVGQGPITQTLQNAIRQDRVPHALLFVGGRGIGKTSCARIFAKALNCTATDGPNPTPCDECASCKSITEGKSVDVFEIDGASNNSVEQIREIRDSVRFSPSVSRQKVYIIDEVHMLSTGAFNALLKTLEEPPPYVTFIFATTEPHKVLDTIISRCQRFDFRQIGVEDIVGALARICEAEGVSAERGALEHIAREAEGGMRDSLSLLDQMISFCGQDIKEADTRRVLGLTSRESLIELLNALVSRNAEAVLMFVQARMEEGDDLSRLINELLSFLRDLMVLKVSAHPQKVLSVSDSDLAMMRAAAEPLSVAQLHRLFNVLMKDAQEILTSALPRLSLEMSLLQLCHQGESASIDEVLSGLVQLEAQLSAAPPPRPSSATVQAPAQTSGDPSAFSHAQVSATSPAPSQPQPSAEASRSRSTHTSQAQQAQQAHSEGVESAVNLNTAHVGFPELPYDLRRPLRCAETITEELYAVYEQAYERLSTRDPFFASELRLHIRPLTWRAPNREARSAGALTLGLPSKLRQELEQSDLDLCALFQELLQAPLALELTTLEPTDELYQQLDGLKEFSERKLAQLALREVRQSLTDPLVLTCAQLLNGHPFYVRPQALTSV